MSGVITDHQRVAPPASAASLSARSAETFGATFRTPGGPSLGYRHLPVDRPHRDDRHGPGPRPARLQSPRPRALLPRGGHRSAPSTSPLGLSLRGARLPHPRCRGRCGVLRRLPARAEPVGGQRLRLRADLHSLRRPADVSAPRALLRDPGRHRLPGHLHRPGRHHHRDLPLVDLHLRVPAPVHRLPDVGTAKRPHDGPQQERAAAPLPPLRAHDRWLPRAALRGPRVRSAAGDTAPGGPAGHRIERHPLRHRFRCRPSSL